MKPLVYIASPYTKGDQAINVRFQCFIFDKILDENIVTPIAPLWSHFQHIVFPRQYESWLQHDFEIIQHCHACLRLNAFNDRGGDYRQEESSGADAEVAEFRRLGRPVFTTASEMNSWAKGDFRVEGIL